MIRAALPGLLLLAAACSSKDGSDPVTDPGYVEPGFPHSGLYAPLASSGYPLLNPDNTFNTAVFDLWARHTTIIAPATPCTDLRRDIVPELRRRNPRAQIFCYVMCSVMWPGYNYDPKSYYRRLWNLINDDSGQDPGPNANWIYWNTGARADDSLHNVNLARRVPQPDGSWRYDFAEALADLWLRDIVSTGLWDGIFIDVFESSPAWIDTPSKYYDYVRAGYATQQEFYDGWKAAQIAMGRRLRVGSGSAFILVGNGGQVPVELEADFNGWLRENFPFQDGGNWTENMFRPRGGYFHEARALRKPFFSCMTPWAAPPTDPYSSYNCRMARFALGSACLGDGFAAMDTASSDMPEEQWTYDEIAVDPGTGAASGSPLHTRWLGRAKGEMAQMIWPNPAADGIANPGFDTDMTGWDWRVYDPAVGMVTRETTGGNPFVRMHVEQTGTSSYYVNLYTPAPVSVAAGQAYALTFRAAASAPRTIDVLVYPASGPEYAYRLLPISTDWGQYQLSFISPATGPATIRFDVGRIVGDVLLDDIHFQAGNTNVFRRDFDRGIVLVNPDPVFKTFTLEQPFKKILGTVCPLVNDGSTVTSVTLGPSDALFLVRP